MAKKSGSNGSHKIGRDARTGHFIPVEEARQRPNTTTVEKIPNPPKKSK